MQQGPIAYCIGTALLFTVCSSFAEDSCPQELETRLIQVAMYEGDGYRPLTDEEKSELAGDGSSSAAPEGWRPESSDEDCKNIRSLVNPEERGYRPLDYGTQGGQLTPAPGYQQPAYDWRYPPYQQYYAPPAYPHTYPGTWPQGTGTYYTQPPFLPGYGIMPYSFGGNSSVPY